MPIERLLLKNLRQGGYLPFGEQAELRRLLGTPLPVLPPPCILADGSEKYFGETHQALRDAMAAYISSLASRIGRPGDGRPKGGAAPDGDHAPYEGLLRDTLGNAMLRDRRMGLVNLFWILHSAEVASAVTSTVAASEDRSLKYQMHPVLSGLCRRVQKSVLSSLSRADAVRVRYRHGSGQSTAIPDIILDDQLSLLHTDMRTFDPGEVLVARNSRFSLSAAAFEEMRDLFAADISDRLARREKAFSDLLLETAPVTSAAEVRETGRLDRYVFQRPVVEFLLHDMEGMAHEIVRNRTLRKEKDRLGGWPELMESFFDVIDAFMRSQIIFCLRETVSNGRKGLAEDDLRKMHDLGHLYRYTPSGEIVNNVQTVTVLFADVRDFTRVSEGLISERGLAEELYAIFDPAAIAIERFGGRIEKFLGDGFMSTFGVAGSPGGRDPLSPARAAIAIQHMLARLRGQGRTSLQMGIGLHTGRAAIARFLLDSFREEITPIGRQVNIAGRLCAAKGAALDMSEEEALRQKDAERAAGIKAFRKSVAGVTVDSDGNLINAGIAVSGGFVDAVKERYDLKASDENGSPWLLHDDKTGLDMSFVYVGEARFKGVEGSVAIYSLAAVENSDGT